MVKPRENRVPIMMSDDELKSIDDWRFTNRIATRSEAVRKLTKAGLKMNELALDFMTEALEKMKDIRSSDEELDAFLDSIEKVEDPNKGRAMIGDYILSLLEHYDRVRSAAWAIYEDAANIMDKNDEILQPPLDRKSIDEIKTNLARWYNVADDEAIEK